MAERLPPLLMFRSPCTTRRLGAEDDTHRDITSSQRQVHRHSRYNSDVVALVPPARAGGSATRSATCSTSLVPWANASTPVDISQWRRHRRTFAWPRMHSATPPPPPPPHVTARPTVTADAVWISRAADVGTRIARAGIVTHSQRVTRLASPLVPRMIGRNSRTPD